MKILISSHAYAPSIGGIETVSRLLAREFADADHEVVVVTQTSEAAEESSVPIVRRPSTANLFSLVKWCDIFWQNNLSLRTIWPALCLRKPVVITHQGSYSVQPSGLDLALRVKRAVANRITSVAISQAVARSFKTSSVIIPNPYDARIFAARSTSTPRAGLIFVGRLVSEKGVDILLEALRILSTRGLNPPLAIVGSGSEQPRMTELARTLPVQDQVKFVGAKNPSAVAEILNQHEILVVPSRYNEPFGVVALEGIACGCIVVGSSGGGLPEAIGPCGTTFANGDADALANALEKLLRNPEARRDLAANAPEHLTQFHPAKIARSYLDLFHSKIS